MNELEKDNTYKSNTFNVQSFMKDWTVEQIKRYCSQKSNGAALAMFHNTGDFNIAQMVRNANFFGANETFYIEGSKHWDRRGTVGSHNYTNVKFLRTADEFFEIIKGNYVPIAVENNTSFKMENIFEFDFPKNPVFIFGEEKAGLSDETLSKCHQVITIPNRGAVRSINVGSCSALVLGLYENYLLKN